MRRPTASMLLSKNIHELSGTCVWRPQSRYTMSRIECRIKFPQNQMSRQNRATPPPPQIKVSHLSPVPPRRTFLSFAAGRGQGGCRGGLVEGIAALLGSENRSRYRGVSQLQSHQSRYSVQLNFMYEVCNGGIQRVRLGSRVERSPVGNSSAV